MRPVKLDKIVKDPTTTAQTHKHARILMERAIAFWAGHA